ncbi:hypothetical protein KC352_g46131, partial [Hortaea werneckii]
MAVKSVQSVSNASIETADGHIRPKNKRKTSVRQQQEQQLFTPHKGASDKAAPQSAGSMRSEGDSIVGGDDDRNQWVKMSRQQPHHQADDPHNLPPSADGGTGTNLDLL